MSQQIQVRLVIPKCIISEVYQAEPTNERPTPSLYARISPPEGRSFRVSFQRHTKQELLALALQPVSLDASVQFSEWNGNTLVNIHQASINALIPQVKGS